MTYNYLKVARFSGFTPLSQSAAQNAGTFRRTGAVHEPRVTAVSMRTRCGIIWAIRPQEGQRHPRKRIGVSDLRALKTRDVRLTNLRRFAEYEHRNEGDVETTFRILPTDSCFAEDHRPAGKLLSRQHLLNVLLPLLLPFGLARQVAAQNRTYFKPTPSTPQDFKFLVLATNRRLPQGSGLGTHTVRR